MGPVKDSGIENFFKNFWQPWHAPKGERTAPIIGFIAATILFLPLFLPAVGIAALAKWAVKHVKDSSSHVQNMASKVSFAASRSSSDSVRGPSEVSIEDAAVLPADSPIDERKRLLEEVYAERKEVLEYVEKLTPEARASFETSKVYRDVLIQLNVIVDNLEQSVNDKEKFDENMRKLRFELHWFWDFKDFF